VQTWRMRDSRIRYNLCTCRWTGPISVVSRLASARHLDHRELEIQEVWAIGTSALNHGTVFTATHWLAFKQARSV
jgi:hypothetical protein